MFVLPSAYIAYNMENVTDSECNMKSQDDYGLRDTLAQALHTLGNCLAAHFKHMYMLQIHVYNFHDSWPVGDLQLHEVYITES